MPWIVTLHITDCNTSSNVSGALITDGYGTWWTDANGDFFAIVNDAWTSYGINISKAGYFTRGFVLTIEMHGSIQNICLNPAPPQTTPTRTGGW